MRNGEGCPCGFTSRLPQVIRCSEPEARYCFSCYLFTFFRGTQELVQSVARDVAAYYQKLRLTGSKCRSDSFSSRYDFAGPLGLASELEGIKKACVIGGGLGCAIAYPQAKALHNLGAKVDIIAGFRNKDIIILEDEMKAVCENLIICTDDGSNGRKNLVTNELEALLQAGEQYDVVIAIGPLVMMKFVCLTTKKYNVKTIVSMNPIMVDGTGMCGGCRLTVGGETKFACVDGPDFDGHLVDFDETIRRSKMYKKFEQEAMERHRCNLEEVINNA
ncbi:MAG: sulfide/dihydroorotate dehydrogenase-like FAD/NAD-binding protein [Clostridia bacterium]|nr:sulfide/dihydroorotate dehydrogenase-like FAD/NAD-binding protein [Clostridia bacterium]